VVAVVVVVRAAQAVRAALVVFLFIIKGKK
jgi:hypothetical protein